MGSAPNPQDNLNTGLIQGQQVAAEQSGLNQQNATLQEQINSQNAAAQLQYLEQAQAGSMVNQSNPYGSLTYSQSGTGPGGVPLWQATTQLSPEQQALFDTLQGTKSTAGQAGSKLLAGANYGSTSPTDAIGSMTSGLTGQVLGAEVNYLQPFQQTEKQQLDTTLRNQGLSPGEPGYDNAMRSLDTSHSLAVQNFLATAEPQAFQQATSLYQMPMTMGEQLAQFGAPGDPTQDFVNAPGLNAPTIAPTTVQPANLISATGSAQDAQMQAYQGQQANNQAMMSGAFGIPTAVLGGWAKSPAGGAAITDALGGAMAFSDEALKENIIEVGRTHDDIPIKLFNYKGDDLMRMGMMAQDVEKVKPEAVYDTDIGYKAVDYVHALLG
jgi:hypothetical protein